MINRGDILISEPYLGDENFDRTVILIGEHNDGGSFGLILNKVSNLILTDVLEDIYDFEVPVYIGGPVEQDTMHFIYRQDLGLEGSIRISDDLYWGGDFNLLKTYINNKVVKPEDIRFFLGYSGWSEGQLQEEVDKNSWIQSRIESQEIFETGHEEMWRDVLKKMGGKYKLLANYPIDPRLN